MITDDRIKTQKLAQDALLKIRSKHLEEQLSKIPPKPVYKHIYEQFDINFLKTKLHYDSAYYNVILNECNKDQIKIANKLVQEVYSDIKTLYQYMNIKPAIYGNRKLIHENSPELLEENAHREISEFISQNYYNLTKKERSEQYKIRVIEESQLLLKTDPSIDRKKAIDRSQKRIIYEQLINTISFPGSLKYTLEEKRLEDSYIEDLMLAFENHVRELSILFSKVK